MAAVVGAVVDGVVAGEEQVAAAAAVGRSTCSGLFFLVCFFFAFPFSAVEQSCQTRRNGKYRPKKAWQKRDAFSNRKVFKSVIF